MDALTRAQLDLMRCGMVHPDGEICNHGGPLTFHSQCHIEAPTWVTYSDGVLTVKCSVCEREVAQVKVASEPVGIFAL